MKVNVVRKPGNIWVRVPSPQQLRLVIKNIKNELCSNSKWKFGQ